MKKSINLMSDAFNGRIYKRMVEGLLRYVLVLIAQEFNRVKHIRFDSETYGYVLRQTCGLS